jgi:hypothetical protein
VVKAHKEAEAHKEHKEREDLQEAEAHKEHKEREDLLDL